MSNPYDEHPDRRTDDSAGRAADLEQTRILEPVPTDDPRIGGLPRRTLMWSAGALVAGLLVGSGITWAVTSADSDPDVAPTASSSPTAALSGEDEAAESASATPETSTTPTADQTSVADGSACTAVITSEDQWTGGFQYDVDVIAGDAELTGWTVTLTVGTEVELNAPWRARLSSLDAGVATFVNEDFNAQVAAGGSTSFGFNGTGTPSADPVVTCAAR